MSNDNFDRLENKLDKIQDSLSNVDKILAVNTESLITHIKRTNLLEERLERELKPVTTHVERVNGILKFVLFLVAISGLIKLIG